KIERNDEIDFETERIWNELKADIKEICSEVKNKEEVLGISIASVGESGVLINEENQVIGPAITWFDSRGQEYIYNLYEDGITYKLYE
ncbi:FGGY family carbohydrate kinase, partial [Alkalihalophilus lindianensis]